MRSLAPILLAGAMLAGCVHQAKHFSAPDSTAIRSAAEKLSLSVDAAKTAVKNASVAVNGANESHATETQKLDDLVPKIDYVFSIAPQQLKPLISDIKMEVAELHEAQMLTTARLDTAIAAQVKASARLDEANAAKNQVAKLSPAYFAEVDSLAERANAAEIGWAKDAKSLAWYRLHWFLGIAVAVGGVLLCLLLAFLKFTGRLAISAAKIAA